MDNVEIKIPVEFKEWQKTACDRFYDFILEGNGKEGLTEQERMERFLSIIDVYRKPEATMEQAGENSVIYWLNQLPCVRYENCSEQEKERIEEIYLKISRLYKGFDERIRMEIEKIPGYITAFVKELPEYYYFWGEIEAGCAWNFRGDKYDEDTLRYLHVSVIYYVSSGAYNAKRNTGIWLYRKFIELCKKAGYFLEYWNDNLYARGFYYECFFKSFLENYEKLKKYQEDKSIRIDFDIYEKKIVKMDMMDYNQLKEAYLAEINEENNA